MKKFCGQAVAIGRVVAFAGLCLAFACLLSASDAGTVPARRMAKPAFYRVAQQDGKWWFITPQGERMFSLGVDCVGTGATRQKYRSANPQYAAFLHYPDNQAWAKATLARLRSWNFNTLGGWCDTDLLTSVPGETMPYTFVIHLGSSFQAPWCDLFSDDLARQFDALAGKLIAPYKNDPRLLGYFSDNELGWWDDTLFLFFLKESPQNATHRVLMRLLRDHYHNDFAALQRDFLAGDAHSFADLERKPTLKLRDGGHGRDVINAFTYRLAERYYQICHAAIRHYDADHLILGDRYAGYCPAPVARAAGKYVDVVSTNYGADWTDGANARCFLDMLHRVTGKPVLITEFYFCAKENRSGDPNTSAGFPTVQTQQERAAGFKTTLTDFAALPYVVGAHWFQYYDEPPHGRGDGENYNMGLVDIEDRPYEKLTASAASLPLSEIHQRRAETQNAESPVPPAAPSPLSGLRTWDKTHSYLADTAAEPFGDLYACWDADHLYLAVYADEYIDDNLYPGKKIPPDERMHLTLKIGKAEKPLRVVFGPGGEAFTQGVSLPCKSWAGSTRFTALVALPASLLGESALHADDRIPLDATLVSHSQGQRMTWRQTLRLGRVVHTHRRIAPGKTSPPFALRQLNGVWWLMTPANKPFFSSGVCCVEPGIVWKDYDPKNPGYAAWQHYPDPSAWADATLARLNSWGFTTIGGWSDYDHLRISPQRAQAFTPVLHVGASAGAPWWDMWDPKVINVMDQVARPQILAVRNDPHLLGYYTDNEMGWWNAALWQMTLTKHSPQSEQRRRLIRLLRDQYKDNWNLLLKDFTPVKADSFAALARGGTLYLRPGGNGMQAIKRFIGMVAERYYALVRQIIRKYDERGLLLGDRFQSFYYPEVAEAAGRYMDVVSTNLNANWNDGSYVRFYLETLHQLAQKPLMIGEFYMTATENRSGNKNNSSGFPVVATQQERAEGFRKTLSALAKTPYVVGADWFQYADEPMNGRGDGENYDMGLVDIHDEPYSPITQTAMALDRNAVHAQPAASRQDARGGVPSAPQDPFAHGKPMQALDDWDRERGFVPPKSKFPNADLYLCWDKDAVYVGLYAIDILENDYYKDKRIPEADRMVWSLRPMPLYNNGQPAPIRIRLGAGRPPVSSDARLTVVNLSGIDHDVRCIAVARLPAALFGKKTLSAGDTIRLSSTEISHARAYRTAWEGAFTLQSFTFAAGR